MADDLDAALDELYAVTPENFVATRAALAKRHGGKVAAALKARRKPTQTAYALNQLARRHPDAIADLVDAGRALARAQRKALRGDAAGVRDAIARQRTVLRERMAEVASLVGEIAVDPGHLPEIAAALQAGLVDPAVGEQLETGHLEKPPMAPAGFPFLSDAAPAPGQAPTKAKAKAKATASAKAGTTRDAAKAAAKVAAAAARTKAREEAERERAERAATKARAQARAMAEKEATRLEAVASRLAREAKEATDAAQTAARAATEARRRANAA